MMRSLKPVPPHGDEDRLPLTAAQRQIWLHEQTLQGAPLYNEAVLLERTGQLDGAALESALDEVMRRHEAWRLTFEVVNGRPVQHVRAPFHVALPVVDLRGVPETSRALECERIAAAHVAQPFDLASGPLVRALLVQLEQERHVLCLAVHHLVADGISVHQIVLPELVALYDSFARGDRPLAPPAGLDYTAYARREASATSEATIAEDRSYWRTQLGGDIPPLDLGIPPRRDATNLPGDHYAFETSADLERQLTDIARSHGATLYTTLLATFLVLLHRYQGHDTALVGTVSSGRKQPELQRVVGCFVRTIVLRVDMSGNPTFLELLARVRRVAWESVSHDDLPFEEIVRDLRPVRAGVRPPFFQAMFTVFADAVLPPGWKVLPRALLTRLVKFDLHLEWVPTGSGLEGRLDYDQTLFDPAVIERMAGHLRTLLASIAADPNRRIGALPLLQTDERRQLSQWNRTARPYPRNRTVHEVFQSQAARFPERVALTFRQERLTYAELDARANAFAARLLAAGVGRGSLVAVYLDRSTEMVVALLAILKAGAGYLPLDSRFPAERLNFILDDASAAAMVTTADLLRRSGLDPGRRPTVMADQGAGPRLAALPPVLVGPDDVAYVTYTSGSTGRPKGVVVPHRGVVRLVAGQDYASLTPHDVLLQLAPLAFDASTFEIWGALLNGARLVIHPPSPPTLEELGSVLEREHVTTLWLTAPLFHEMVDRNIDGLRYVKQLLTGGDVVSSDRVRKLLLRGWGTTVIDGYGPTENTTFTSCYPMRDASQAEGRLPIGRPISNTTVFVLDRYHQPCPINVAGELYVGGDGLALGYLNRPELSAERFVSLDLGDGVRTRVYRTGDRVRFLPDGNLDFLGRLDTQTKIRGFRIEPGEIEAALLAHDSVREAAVVVNETDTGEKRLVACVVASDGTDRGSAASALRAHLSATLPDYMVPSSFVFLDALPTTSSGKLDRALLASSSAAAHPTAAARHGAEPSTATARALAEIWRRVLGVPVRGIDDNFFDLGGDSMQAVRLFAEIKDRLGRSLPLATLFSAPTLGRLAEALDEGAPKPVSSPLIAIRPTGTRAPLFCVHPIGGEVLCYVPLAELLGDDQPFYALTVMRDEVADREPTIQQMAQQYVRAMKEVRPAGPYVVGGYSFGGIVAYEMARQLVAAGDEVPMLAIIDSLPPNTSAPRPTLTRMMKNAVHRLPWWLSEGRYGQKARHWLHMVKWRGLVHDAPAALTDEQIDAMFANWLPGEYVQVARRLVRAAYNYSPPPYPGRATLFRAAAVPLLLAEEPEVSWSRFVQGGLDTRLIAGSHMRFLHEPDVRALAAELRACLDAVVTSRAAAHDDVNEAVHDDGNENADAACWPDLDHVPQLLARGR